MLALKSVVRSDAAGLTLVFDEVDAGIGGRVAEVVGRKLAGVAGERQVLCVTHLAQIAAFADRHYLVRKSQRAGRTLTSVEPLDEEGRVEELARMVGGERVSATARHHAGELLRAARA
jgi:DNA repair protein RecN (Recombination protein N)